MANNKKISNQLLLLAGTTLVLCVAVLSNSDNSVSNSLQGMVLSDRDEANNTKEFEEKAREEEKNRIEFNTEKSKNEAERIREEEKKRQEIKLRERKASPKPPEVEDQNREERGGSDMDAEFEIEVEGAKAATDLPLKLNNKTNKLNVTTRDGKTTELTILPDQVVEKLTDKKVEIIGQTVLVENQETGEFEYKAKAVERKRLFGLFSIRLNKEFIVSGEDGSLEEVELTGLDRVLNLLSF